MDEQSLNFWRLKQSRNWQTSNEELRHFRTAQCKVDYPVTRNPCSFFFVCSQWAECSRLYDGALCYDAFTCHRQRFVSDAWKSRFPKTRDLGSFCGGVNLWGICRLMVSGGCYGMGMYGHRAHWTLIQHYMTVVPFSRSFDGTGLTLVNPMNTNTNWVESAHDSDAVLVRKIRDIWY